MLKPVIPVVAKVISGTICGKVVDKDGNPMCDATATAYQTGTTTTVNSASSDAEGIFRVHCLPAGTYDVEVSKEGYSPDKKTGISVTAQQSTDAGVFTLNTL